MPLPRAVVFFLIVLSVVTLASCSSEPRDGPIVRPGNFQDYVPLESTGRRPAGTREDPFVAIGVMKSVIPLVEQDLIRIDVAHRAIPFFKKQTEMGVYVPPEVVAGVNEGDFVKLYYAKLVEGTRAAVEFKKAMQVGSKHADWRRPHVWFGYELYKIISIPDAEYWRNYGQVLAPSRPDVAAVQK